jgi:hypothetical protein
MQKGTYQMLGKYEFQVPEECSVDLKVQTPIDKYLHDFIRLRIVDRSPEGPTDVNKNEVGRITTVNSI